MRAVLSTLVTGGLLIAGCATAPALSTPQGTPAAAAPAPMPSHETGQTPAPSGEAKPNAAPGQAPRPNPLRQLIAGKENQPAETVFKNIQVLKGVPAGRFLETMEAFSHALGTNCRKCHDTENFASDDKDDKKVARGMITMTRDINEKYVKTMPGLDSDAFVGCNTCHHGQSHPNAKPKDPAAGEPEHHG
jgi:hypothetical protein